MLEIKKVNEIPVPKTFLFYGKSGTGKTTLAGTFPKPLFLDINENGTSSVDNKEAQVISIKSYDDFNDFLEKNPGAVIYMASTKAPNVYTEVSYEDGCYLMFGKESAGIPEEILAKNQERAVRIPMLDKIRSLNLGNSVAIVLYEALRQQRFAGMQLEGHLTRYDWK